MWIPKASAQRTEIMEQQMPNALNDFPKRKLPSPTMSWQVYCRGRTIVLIFAALLGGAHFECQAKGQEARGQETLPANTSADAKNPSQQPNIVYILADDMGYSDIGCYGSEIQTPNLDLLANGGLRFTQFYNMARCCPTRASLLTGLYPHQAGIGHMLQETEFPGYRNQLNRNCVTIAEVLKTAGYRTYMAGKWHVTSQVNPSNEAQKNNWPCQRGFDHFYGTIHGAGSFYDPNSLTRDNQLISPYADPEYQPTEPYYYTDAITDHAVGYIQKHHQQSPEQPLFMYVSYTAAHWPMHARPADIQKYHGKYQAGYQSIQAARYQRMKQLRVIQAENTQLAPMDPRWLETEFFDWDQRNMEVYAAMIDRMDQGIGKITAALQQTGQFQNTLIIYLQDNGGCAEGYGRGTKATARPDQPTFAALANDYLQTAMQPAQTRDGFPVRTGKGVMAGPDDTYIGYGQGWATVSNTPFREYKHWTHEGGISTPLIAHWPGQIQRVGQLESTPGHVIDLMATAVDIAGAKYPEKFHQGDSIKPMEGKSLLPVFHGKSITRKAIYWEHEGNRAIRVGDDKLVAKGPNGKWELYDMTKDRSEQNDLAGQNPEKVAKLAAMWQAYAQRSNVLPLTPYNKPPPQTYKKNKLTFALAQDADLTAQTGPYVVNRGIRVSANISQTSDGVIVAQGGVTHGWAVYLKQDRLCFATTVSGKRTQLVSQNTIKGPGELILTLTTDRTVAATWNQVVVLQSSVGQLLTQQPLDGLQVGSDQNGAVGDYPTPFTFTGKIQELTIQLQK